MIPINIQKQCEILHSRLRVELLTSDESNKKKIQTFHTDKRGKGLERYLKEDAWEDDQKGVTKVYLVKDSDNIVFFFALSADSYIKKLAPTTTSYQKQRKKLLVFA